MLLWGIMRPAFGVTDFLCGLLSCTVRIQYSTVTSPWTVGSAMCASLRFLLAVADRLCNAVHTLTVAAVVWVTCHAYALCARPLSYSHGAIETRVTCVTVRIPDVICVLYVYELR